MRQSKRFTALALALALVLSLTTGASAAQPKAEQVKANIDYGITVKHNGEAKALSNVNGQQVYPVLCGGTTYVPIRAIGYLLGLNVDWNQATRTVLLSDPAQGELADTRIALPDIPRKTGTEAVTPTIDPGITVKYNGVTQEMKTVKGEAVYPILLGGTTYLPIRAVGDMLGLDVGWEQATKTVTLTTSSKLTLMTSKGPVTVDLNDAIITDDGIKIGAFSDALMAAGIDLNSDEGHELLFKITDKIYEHQQALFETANDTVYTDTGASNQYLAVDWSTADKGYINVKMKDSTHEKLGSSLKIWQTDEKGRTYSKDYKLFPGDEYDIPLEGGSGEYLVEFSSTFMDWLVCQHLMPENTKSYEKIYSIAARFTAKIDDPDGRWLVSTPDIDFRNAPNACAKALEITKDCKTDAEKITAVFNWVANNITYDQAAYELWKKNVKEYGHSGVSRIKGTCMEDPNSSKHWDATAETATYGDDNPDSILAAKKGMCHHYATLMTAMLRSLGVKCKYVSGAVPNENSAQGANWDPHAWVSVDPKLEKELNMSALGAGHDSDGWIRLDPTWGGTAYGRAAASVDADHAATGWE